MLEVAGVTLDRLDKFMASFRGDFRRRDQLRWASIYLHGLLGPAERKTIGTMAKLVTLPPDLPVKDIAQAMQNFINQSPWDEGKIWQRHRELLRDEFAEADGAFIVEDLPFLKQGRHSVGVQRQYSAALNCKTNCQVAVALHYQGSSGVCPLSLRLYLPKAWLANEPLQDSTGVPLEYRGHQSKGNIALNLLDEARGEGWTGQRVLVGPAFGTDPDFLKALEERGLTLKRLDDSEPVIELRRTLTEELGLDHFEGRSWRGFHHHACLVMVAYAFRKLEG